MEGISELFDPLRAGYPLLLERIREHAERDDRVRALWLHGSVAKGLADRDSDLDVILTIVDDEAPSFGAGLGAWMGEVIEPVFTKAVGGRILLFLTRELQRIDLFVETVSEIEFAGDRHRVLVFDKDTVAAALPPADLPRGPSPARVDELVKDFIAELSMMTGVVGRQDWVFGLESVHRSRTTLHQLLVEANRPLPPYGAKQWTAQLTEGQRELFAALPPVTASRDSVLGAKWATVELFYLTAPRIAESLGVLWPTELEQAVSRFLATELGYSLPCDAARS